VLFTKERLKVLAQSVLRYCLTQYSPSSDNVVLCNRDT